MPVTIETFAPVFAAARGMRDGIAALPSRDLINAFHDLLPSVGWTVTDSLYPTAGIYWPFGAPVIPASETPVTPKTAVSCTADLVRINGVSFQLYDPNTETPVTSGSCVMAAAGTTAAASLGNLRDAITAASAYDCTLSGPDSLGGYTLSLQGKIAGPDLNFGTLTANGRWALAGVIDGGGYEFQSAGVVASQYKVRIYAKLSDAVFPFNEGRVILDFVLNGASPVQYRIDTVTGSNPQPGPYTIVAHPHQFAVFDPSSSNPAVLGSRASSLFACAPKITSSGVTYAVFLVGPGNLRTTTYWQSGIAPSTTCIDAPPSTYGGTGGWPRLVGFDSPGTVPLTTPAGKPILGCAYVMFGKNSSDNAGIVGKVWDSLISSDLVADGLVVNGNKYKLISSHSGAAGVIRSSFLLRIA